MFRVRSRGSNQIHPRNKEVSDYVEIPLLEIESGIMSMGDGIHTINFYDGDYQAAAAYLKERFKLVAEQNPWITGHLYKRPGEKETLIHLRYPKDYLSMVDSIVKVCNEKDLTLTKDMEYKRMCDKVKKSSAWIAPGLHLVKTASPICKLTIVPMGISQFGVIFALSHSIADGYTYYTLLNMLAKDGDIFEMIVERDESLRKPQPQFVGEKEYDFMTWSNQGTWHLLGRIFNALGALISSKQPKSYCFMLDQSRLQLAKDKAKQEMDAAPYVSTNDIFTCGFAKVIDAKLFSMGIDFRDRIPGLTKRHAGCYQLGLLWGPEGYDSPNTMRKALIGRPPLSRATIPTNCFGQIHGNVTGSITNWATFSNGNGLEISECSLNLHLPVVNLAMAIFDLAVIFKPRPGQVAAMMFVQKPTEEDLKRELPIGGNVSQTLFRNQRK